MTQGLCSNMKNRDFAPNPGSYTDLGPTIFLGNFRGEEGSSLKFPCDSESDPYAY